MVLTIGQAPIKGNGKHSSAQNNQPPVTNASGSFIKIDTLRPISIFTPDVRSQHVTAVVDRQKLGHLATGNGQRRTAEVIFVVRRMPDILLVRRSIYPAGIYRLPTGGIEAGETPQQAAVREIYEETGYRVTAPGLLGVIQYTLQVADTSSDKSSPDIAPDCIRLPFVSYVFVADVAAGEMPAAGLPDEVDDYRWVASSELGYIAAQLREVNEEWRYWGRFRAVPYEFIQANLQ